MLPYPVLPMTDKFDPNYFLDSKVVEHLQVPLPPLDPTAKHLHENRNQNSYRNTKCFGGFEAATAVFGNARPCSQITGVDSQTFYILEIFWVVFEDLQKQKKESYGQ